MLSQLFIGFISINRSLTRCVKTCRDLNAPHELQTFLQPDIQELLALHGHDDPVRFAMQFHGRRELPVRAMAEQLACRQKAAKKLPNLSQHTLLYTPLALEQSSCERTAIYKASLFSGKRLMDLSGGLGIDDGTLLPIHCAPPERRLHLRQS